MTAPFQLPLAQIVGRNGVPVSGFSIRFVDSTTKKELTAFKDAARTSEFGTKVNADSHGTLPAIWLEPTGRTYDAILTFPDGRERMISDLQLPPPDDPGGVKFFPPRLPTILLPGPSVQITPEHFGNEIGVPTGGQDAQVLLPSPRDVEDGRIIGFRNMGDTFNVVLTPITVDDGIFPILRPGASLYMRSSGIALEIISYVPPVETIISGPASNKPMSLRDSHPSGTTSIVAHGGSPTILSGTTNHVPLAWQQMKFNTLVGNQIQKSSFNSDSSITLPAGTYLIKARRCFSGALGGACLRFRSLQSSKMLVGTPIEASAIDQTANVWATVEGPITIDGTEKFVAEFVMLNAASATFLGNPVGLAGVSEVYGELDILALAGDT